jgi:hypothetical protein
MHISCAVLKQLKRRQFRHYAHCFKMYGEVRQVCTGFLFYEHMLNILTFNTLMDFWCSKNMLMFLFYFSLLVLADPQKLGLKQQLRNLEKQLNDLKVSLSVYTV